MMVGGVYWSLLVVLWLLGFALGLLVGMLRSTYME